MYLELCKCGFSPANSGVQTIFTIIASQCPILSPGVSLLRMFWVSQLILGYKLLQFKFHAIAQINGKCIKHIGCSIVIGESYNGKSLFVWEKPTFTEFWIMSITH